MLTALGSRPWDWQNLMALLGSRRRDANDELPTAVVVADEESPADNRRARRREPSFVSGKDDFVVLSSDARPRAG